MEELTQENKLKLQERQTEIIKIIESLSTLSETKEWQILKELVFNKSIDSIERQMLNQAMSQKIDTDKLYKLQGEWAWAKQYSDLNIFAESLKTQLAKIKELLK